MHMQTFVCANIGSSSNASFVHQIEWWTVIGCVHWSSYPYITLPVQWQTCPSVAHSCWESQQFQSSQKICAKQIWPFPNFIRQLKSLRRLKLHVRLNFFIEKHVLKKRHLKVVNHTVSIFFLKWKDLILVLKKGDVFWEYETQSDDLFQVPKLAKAIPWTCHQQVLT